MECTLRNKQYVGKRGIYFSTKLNNHRKDAKDANTILVTKYFQAVGHNFNKHAKFIIKDKLVSVNSTKDVFTRTINTKITFSD